MLKGLLLLAFGLMVLVCFLISRILWLFSWIDFFRIGATQKKVFDLYEGGKRRDGPRYW